MWRQNVSAQKTSDILARTNPEALDHWLAITICAIGLEILTNPHFLGNGYRMSCAPIMAIYTCTDVYSVTLNKAEKERSATVLQP